MKVDSTTRSGRWLLSLAGRLARWLLLALGATLRVRVVVGQEQLRQMQDSGSPVILSYWHDRSFLSAGFLYRQLHRKGFAMTLLASQSRDGEMVSRMVEAWGIETVRGSSSRGGHQALRAMHRALTRKGSSPILIPDGPKGPIYTFKVGVAVLAQTSGAPILPLGFAAERPWHLRSWDRMIVPRPFSRVAIVVGQPYHVPAKADATTQEMHRLELEALIDDATRRAEAAVDGTFAKDVPET